MEVHSDAPLDDGIEEIKDKVTTCISERLACRSPNPLWLHICKVQDSLRNVNKMAYEPIVLSIGPYHHGKAHLQKMEDLKLDYLQSLLERRNETDASRYVEVMREMEEIALECYTDPFKLDDKDLFKLDDKDDFGMMMVVDGCFIVELFIRHFQKDMDDHILGNDWTLRSIQRDLLLCENQLPYFVLLELLKMVELPDEENTFDVYAQDFFMNILGGGSEFRFFDRFYINFNHLLGMIYHQWCPSFALNFNIRTRSFPRVPKNWIFKFSATELREAGIKFKRAKDSTNPFEIKFSNGVLEIPHLTIDYHTESLFRNLLAYEQQPQQFTFNYITDYISFMDILIDSEKDVQILRHRGIIQNGLGDDKAVCTMFNKFCESLIFRGGDSYYFQVLSNMNEHCKKSWHAWMANLRHNYFNSPWAWISVLAAAFVILFTATQTVYAIISYSKK